jgi:hypothetical protein
MMNVHIYVKTPMRALKNLCVYILIEAHEQTLTIKEHCTIKLIKHFLLEWDKEEMCTYEKFNFILKISSLNGKCSLIRDEL